jgi:signal transduction histidine kinase
MIEWVVSLAGLVAAGAFAFRASMWKRRARRTESRLEALETVLEGSGGVAHDLRNLLSGVALNLDELRESAIEGRTRVDGLLEECQDALDTSNRLLAALAVETSGNGPQLQTSDFVRLQASLHRDGVPIDVQVSGDLDHHGKWSEADRLVRLLFRDVVAAAEASGDRVKVTLDDDGLRFQRRPVRGGAPRTDADSVPEPVRRAASQLGWKVETSGEGDPAIVVRPAD